MWRTCKIWDFYTERFGAQRADKHEKTEFGIFLRAKRPIFKLRNITLNGINPQTNVTYMQNLRFLHWMVWRTACGQTWKNGFLACFCARSAQFLNYEKITFYGINLHTNLTYMQNLRFLHWTVWRTACGRTDKQTDRQKSKNWGPIIMTWKMKYV